jgi:hypothetical protein
MRGGELKYIVIPPYSDPTLVYHAPPGWQVYDLMHAFVERILTEVNTLPIGYETSLPASASQDQDTRNRQLLCLAGRQLLARADHPHRWLRACGAILSGQPHSSAVRLRLDDLEVVNGTTESSADILLASEKEAPYTPELLRICTELAQAETLRLHIDTDKQLPAAIWLARAFAFHRNVEVSGHFALRYAPVLRRIPVFENMCFVPVHEHCCQRIVDTLPGLSEQLWWGAYGEIPEIKGAPWGGPIPLKALLEPESLLESAIKVAVVTFTSLGEIVLDAWGQPFSHAELCHSAMRLRERGVRVVAEWLVGAPMINEEHIEKSLIALDKPCFFDWVAGVRRFHWPVDRQRTMWGGHEVELTPLDARLDLARTHSFSAADTLPQGRLPYVMDELAQTLMRRAPLSPGRVAGAYCVAPPDLSSGAPGTIRIEPDCSIVHLTCEDHSKDGWFAVNLRLQNIIAMDQRLAIMLHTLHHFQAPELALPTIPEVQRSKIVASLCRHGVLVEATI